MLLDQFLKNPRLQLDRLLQRVERGLRRGRLRPLKRDRGAGGHLQRRRARRLNAVACTYAENLPVVAISGGTNSDSEADGHVIHHALGEVRYDYQRQIYDHVTAGAFAVRRLEDAPAVIDRAVATAIRRRKPVYLEIDCNLAALAVPAPTPRELPGGLPQRPGRPGRRRRARGGAARRRHAAGSRRGPAHPATGLSGRVPQARRRRRLRGGRPAGRQGHVPREPLVLRRPVRGPISSPGVASLVESADAYLFAGGVLSDYSTAGYSTLIDPGKLLLAGDDDVHLPAPATRASPWPTSWRHGRGGAA